MFKKTWAIVLLVGFSVGAAFAANADTSDAALQAQVMEVDGRIDQAVVNGDATTLAGLYTDDFVYVHSGGMVDSKESWLKSAPHGKGFYLGRKNESVTVQFHNDTALVSSVLLVHYNVGISEKDASKNAAPYHRAHQLRVYYRFPDGWKLAYQHVTYGMETPAQELDVMRYIYSKGYYGNARFKGLE